MSRPTESSCRGNTNELKFVGQRKIRQQPQAGSLTLFRMKLHTADIFLGNYRRIERAVISFTNDHRRVIRFAGIRMDEIKEGVVLNARQQRMNSALSHLVPTNLRNNEIAGKIPRKAADATLQQT